MVAGDQRDGFDLVGLEAAQIAVLDQVVRVLVVPLVADVDADVVQQGRVFEPLALAVGQAVNAARLVEQRRRQPRDLLRVLGPVVAPLGQLDDAAAADVGIAIGLRDLLAVPRDVVEDQPFAQRQVAERDLGGAEPAEDRVEEDRAGDREVGAPRIEARHAQALLEIERGERLAHAAQLLGGDAAVAQRRADRTPALGCRDRAEAQDRARRADHAIEAGLRDLVEVVAQLGLDVPHQLALVARRRSDRS